MKYNKMSRRMFLQGSGTTLMSIPFLPSLLPREAWGQTAAAPKRYISIQAGFEVGHNSAWLPNSAGGSTTNLIQPSQTFNPGGGDHAIRYQSLRSYAPNSTTPLALLYGTTLNNHLNYINIMRSLDIPVRYGHGSGATLGSAQEADNGLGGAVRQVPTLDAILANNRTLNPNGRYIFAGDEGGWEGYSRTLTGAKSTRIDTFRALYNALFDNGNLPESGGTGGTTGTPAHPRRDLLSRVLEDYTRMMNSRNISSADKVALTNAMDKMSDVHRGLSAGTPSTPSTNSCSHQGLSASATGQIYNAPTYDDKSALLVNMITAAILCDSNRIFTFGFWQPYTYETVRSDWPSDVLRYTGPDWHEEISHRPFNVSNGQPNWYWIAHRQKYLVSRIFAPLVRNLAGATDPSNGQSYLYNSLVHLSYESGQAHGHMSHPTILAGNVGGAFTSGNYIDYADRSKGVAGGADGFSDSTSAANFCNNYYGLHYNRLLVKILQAFGMTPDQYENNALNAEVYNRTDIGANNRNLTAIGGFNYAYRMHRDRDWFFDAFYRWNLPHYNLQHFRNPIPLPPSST